VRGVFEIELGQLLALRFVERGDPAATDLARQLFARVQRQRGELGVAGSLEQRAVQREIEAPTLGVFALLQEGRLVELAADVAVDRALSRTLKHLEARGERLALGRALDQLGERAMLRVVMMRVVVPLAEADGARPGEALPQLLFAE